MKAFTRSNVVEVLRQWPQAVSMDEGDLHVLHDMADAGANMWRESLPWPDYLWLDFEGDLPTTAATAGVQTHNLIDPSGRAPPASFSAMKLVVGDSQLPPSGSFQISGRTLVLMELKVIDTNFVPKLFSYKPVIPWADFVRIKFDQWFGDRLRDADRQIAGGRRLLPLGAAHGVAILVNEHSANLPIDLVMAYLAGAINHFENLDCIVYLADRDNMPQSPAFAMKNNDPQLNRFSTQMLMMLRSFDYHGSVPASRSGKQPQLLARIEMDARSRAMYRSWAAGWRQAHDPSPVPNVSMSISFVPREQFVSGLPKTAPDKSLLDCKFAWDFDRETMTIRNLRITR